MRKTILLLVTSLLVIGTTDAQSQETLVDDSCYTEDKCSVYNAYFYGKIFGGPNFLQDTTIDGNSAQYKTGYMIAGSMGYRWSCGLCLEGEYAFRRNNIEEIQFIQQGSSNQGYLETSSYMANLLWDLPFCFDWSDYCNTRTFMGVGIGYDLPQMSASNSRVDFEQWWDSFSWQLMAGIAYPIFGNTEVTLEYKFHQGGSHFCNHVIGVGIDYKFGYSE